VYPPPSVAMWTGVRPFSQHSPPHQCGTSILDVLHCRRRLGLRLAQLPSNNADEQQREVEPMRQKVLADAAIAIEAALDTASLGGVMPFVAINIWRALRYGGPMR
jgi:hypothetical protein